MEAPVTRDAKVYSIFNDYGSLMQTIKRKVPSGPNPTEPPTTRDAKAYPISNDYGSLIQTIKRKVPPGPNPIEPPATRDAKAYSISNDYGSLVQTIKRKVPLGPNPMEQPATHDAKVYSLSNDYGLLLHTIMREVPSGPNPMEPPATHDTKAYSIFNDYGSLMQIIKRKVPSGPIPMEPSPTRDAKTYSISNDYAYSIFNDYGSLMQTIRRKVPLGPNLMEPLETRDAKAIKRKVPSDQNPMEPLATRDAKVYSLSNDYGLLLHTIMREVPSGPNPMEPPTTRDVKTYSIFNDYGSLMETIKRKVPSGPIPMEPSPTRDAKGYSIFIQHYKSDLCLSLQVLRVLCPEFLPPPLRAVIGLDASLHPVMLQPWSLHKLDFLIIPSLIHVPLVIGMVLVLIMLLAIKYSDQFYRVRVTHHSDLSLECGPANRPDPEGLTICQLMEGILISKVPAGLLPPGSASPVWHSGDFQRQLLPLHPSVQGQCRISILPYTFKSSCNWLMDIKGRIYGQPIPPFRLSSFRHLQVGLRSFEDRPHLSSAGRTLRIMDAVLILAGLLTAKHSKLTDTRAVTESVFEFPQVELHKPRQMHRTLLSLDSSVLGEECIIQRIGQIYGCEDYWFISLSLYYAVIQTGQAVSLIQLTSIIFEVFYQHLSSERPLRLESSPDCQRNRSSLTRSSKVLFSRGIQSMNNPE
ncbi:hypothetical protein VNO77_27414 [Canavalia gladiata]|uniref:Uncharacterized protein n=1 Tax=Canavalia gladiata TaxID=3824 RepID=A0AAN9Q6F8_CANGL